MSNRGSSKIAGGCGEGQAGEESAGRGMGSIWNGGMSVIKKLL